MSTTRTFGLWSGVGLVVADMVGAGVFLSTGFMAQSMRPGLILLAWVVGGVLAMAGARAYAEVARIVPGGGGEYRFLSDLLHPSLGYLAGWASLLVGFSAPVAVDALAAGAFARALFPSLDPRLVGAVLVVLLTATHAIGLRASARTQNVLVLLKVVLVIGFVLVGMTAGTVSWPSWTPQGGGDGSLGNFANQLFWIAFAYSGWNAAVYAADDFKEPARDVPRAMVIGCALVAVAYLAINYVFVANLTPEQGSVVFNYADFAAGKGQWDQVTLGQALMGHLLGGGAAKVMSVVTLIIFVSAMSAMMIIGPRVYAAMARDGVLPKALMGKDDKPPMLAVALQGALALLILFTHDLQSVLSDLGAILTLFSALTVAGLFKVVLVKKEGQPRPSLVSLAAAGVYVLSSALILWFGVDHLVQTKQLSVLWWAGGVAAIALVAWAATRALQRRPA